MNKNDYKAFLNDDAILDGFLSGIYLINAHLYLSPRADDRRAAERFFKSDFFKERFGDQADVIIEELNRKRRKDERKIKCGIFVKKKRGANNDVEI